MLIHTDCRYYEGSMPCVFHKKDGRLCENCPDYDPVRTRILIIKLAAIGDVLRTTSILPALKGKYPNTQISWLTKSNAAALLEGNPLIDRVLVTEGEHIEFLLNESFSIGICLDADPHSATLHVLSRCDQRFGFVTDAAGNVQTANDAAQGWWWMGLNDDLKRKNRKTYQRIMYEICELPLPTARPQLHLPDQAGSAGQALRRSPALQSARKLIGINTGGGSRWQHKKWTFDGYLTCINRLKETYPDAGLLLLGGPEEVDINRRILEMAGDKIVDGGCDNSLTEFASIINILDVLVTSDSLAMHIGVALEKPTIVLVGPTSPWELDVFGHGAILHSDIECLSCYLSRCNKTVTCMSTLAAGTVINAVSEYL